LTVYDGSGRIWAGVFASIYNPSPTGYLGASRGSYFRSRFVHAQGTEVSIWGVVTSTIRDLIK